jgi:hypothetical protein
VPPAALEQSVSSRICAPTQSNPELPSLCFGWHAARMSNDTQTAIAPHVAQLIRTVRAHRVILDSDLAPLYGVTTKALNQAVRRNYDRFPADFLFQLTDLEAQSLRSQFVTLDVGRGKYGKYAPLASELALLFSIQLHLFSI